MKRRQPGFWYVVAFGVAAMGLALAQAAIDAGSHPTVGEAAPPLGLRDLDGRGLRLADLRGRVVLVDFWARWCGPCVRQLPALERLHRKLQGRSFRLLSVNVEAVAPGELRAWVHARSLTFPVTQASGDALAAWRIASLPLMVLVDRAGRVRRIYGAGASEGSLEADIASLVGT